MLLDETLEFADALGLNQSGTDTDNFGDVIDLGVARDIGQGQPLYLVIQITASITSGGNAEVAFQLVSDGTDTINTSTQTIHVRSAALAKETLVAGFQIVLPVPSEGPVYEQFLAVQTVTTTTALNGGSANAFLTIEPTVKPTTSYADAAN